MAKVIEVIGSPEGSTQFAALPSALTVKAGTTASIGRGFLVVDDTGNAGYSAAAADGTASTADILGVANGPSNETASADGVVNIVTAPRIMARMFAKTAGSLTEAMKNDKFILDVTSGNYTFDQATTTNGFIRLIDILDTTTGECLVEIYTS